MVIHKGLPKDFGSKQQNKERLHLETSPSRKSVYFLIDAKEDLAKSTKLESV